MKFVKLTSAVIAAALLLQGCAGLIVAGAATTAAVANDRRTVGSQLDDTSIEFKAQARLRERKDIWDNSNISVTSMNGILLVVGQVPTEHLKNETDKVLKGLQGVRRLHNQVKIATPAGLSTLSNDSWITAQVKSKLLDSQFQAAMNIKVVTENGEVYLMGLVSRSEAEHATEIARHVKGVAKVIRVFEYQDDKTS